MRITKLGKSQGEKKMANIHKFSVNEASNVGLGQSGSMLVDTASANKTPTGSSIVAITFLEDTTFSALVQTDAAKHAGTSAVSFGYAVDSSNTFPQGVTLFGNYSSVTLASGRSICYFG